MLNYPSLVATNAARLKRAARVRADTSENRSGATRLRPYYVRTGCGCSRLALMSGLHTTRRVLLSVLRSADPSLELLGCRAVELAG